MKTQTIPNNLEEYLADKTYSIVAIDYEAGFTITKEGTMKPNKIGCYVDSYEKAYQFAKDWRN